MATAAAQPAPAAPDASPIKLGRCLGVEVFASLPLAIAAARSSDAAPFVIGGARLYAAALPLVTDLHITHVNVELEAADTFFPAFDPEDFVEVTRRVGEDPRLLFVQLKRREMSASFD